MLSDRAILALGDIVEHIDYATEFTSGHTLAAFVDDAKTVFAVTRCLEIVSEASRRLPPELKAKYPAIQWREIADAGNIYRHVYQAVTPATIWSTVHDHLPSLRQVVVGELAALPPTTDTKDAP